MLQTRWINAVLASVLALSNASPLLAAPPAASGGATVSAGDWPKWLGPDGTGVSKESLPDKWPAAGPKQLWSAKVGLGYSSAVAADGKVYFFGQTGTKETLTAFDADTGKSIWSESYAGGYPKNDYPGVRSTPTIDGDKIFTFGGAGQLTGRDLKTGKQLWTLNVLEATKSELLTWGQASTPQVIGEHIFVQAGAGGPVAIAVDKASGKILWQSEAKGNAGYAQIIQADVGGAPQLIVFAGTGLFAINPADGKTIWKQEWKTSYEVNAATPVYDGKGKLFVASGYGTGGGLFELSATGAKKVWGPKKELQCKFNPPILDGGYIYAVSEDKRGTIRCVEWATGKVAWELAQPKVGFGGSIFRAGDKLIAQSQTGEVSLIKATPTAGEMLSTFKPFDGSDKVWSTPIVYKGKMYAKGQDELVCFEVK